MKRNVCLSMIIFLLLTIQTLKSQENEIDLAGQWEFQLDVMDFGCAPLALLYNKDHLQDSIRLPGITDDHGFGIKSNYTHIDRLTRAYEYMGPAWYQKYVTIPKDWEGKSVILNLERCHWLSTIYVDGKKVGKNDYISIPHRYDLTSFFAPGKEHRITICMDNRFQYPTHKWNHAHTEYTQINWNGILGNMKLLASEPVSIQDIQVFPDIKSKSIKVKMECLNRMGKEISGKIFFEVSGEKYLLNDSMRISKNTDSTFYNESTIFLGDKIKLWDEFTPHLYKLSCSLECLSENDKFRYKKSVTFGMREVKQGKNHIMINDRPVHLRGTVENAVFPKTGYVPVDDASWERIMRILKEYGMNHMRFHSWCPPAAAFRAADKLGVYLQVELPFWGGDADGDEGGRFDFFRREQKAILREYGNHPSFVLYCNGNEIQGDFEFIEELVLTGRKLDNRRIYSGATARKRVQSDQFYVSHVTNKGRITVYQGKESTDWDVNNASDIDVPVIAHEAGQRCMYPDFKEISEFTGPVKPRNFEVFKKLLARNGMEDLSENFFRASGALTVVEYKEVIEALLRSSKSGGFQLLSINDFPGQGYAFVGILDPFWNSKGLITSEKFCEFCSSQVPLLRFPKWSYFNDESFKAKAELYSFGALGLKHAVPKWEIRNAAGKVLKSGKMRKQNIPTGGVFELGEIVFNLEKIVKPEKLSINISIGKQIKNRWNIWVYPRNTDLMQSTDEVLYTKKFDDKAKQYLLDGKKVIFCPQPKEVIGRKSNFHNHFWNPIMFKWPPMTLGCLIHEEHPVFNLFPTEYHTNWQWWDILNYAKVIEMTNAPHELYPFIQPIDSHDNNQKLGIGFEAKVSNGKLLVLALDTEKEIGNRPATRQLLYSVDKYVKSSLFDPKVVLNESFIESFIQK